MAEADHTGDDARALQRQGIALFEQGRLDEAQNCFERGLQLVQRQGLTRAAASFCYELSLVASLRSDYSGSFDLARQAAIGIAADSLAKSGGREEPLMALEQIAFCLMNAGDAVQAEKVLLVLKESYEARNDLPNMAKVSSNLGAAALVRGDEPMGRTYLARARELAMVSGDPGVRKAIEERLRHFEQLARSMTSS